MELTVAGSDGLNEIESAVVCGQKRRKNKEIVDKHNTGIAQY